MSGLGKRRRTGSRAAAAALVLAAGIGGFSGARAQDAAPEQVDVFSAGQDGYAVCRIPATVTTTSGTVLAFAEGRRLGRGDAGDIDLVLRRSRDGGKTWAPLQVVWDDGANTCGNPAPVVDRRTGRIWLFSTWNLGTDREPQIMDGTSTDTRRVFVTHSDDEGVSWAAPDEVTSSVKGADWRWYATGPGHGIQLADGRLVIPANHSVPKETGGHPYRAHVILSGDGGRTWSAGATVGERTNESSVAELADGRLYMNMRSYHGLNRRAVSWSGNGAQSWEGVFLDPELIEPVCQASVLRHDGTGADAGAGEYGCLHLFSNPASKKRERMTVRVSRDSCRTWSPGRVLHEGPAAYSDLCSLSSTMVGCLYERDRDGEIYGRITFARMELPWLLGSGDAGTSGTREGEGQ